MTVLGALTVLGQVLINLGERGINLCRVVLAGCTTWVVVSLVRRTGAASCEATSCAGPFVQASARGRRSVADDSS